MLRRRVATAEGAFTAETQRTLGTATFLQATFSEIYFSPKAGVPGVGVCPMPEPAQNTTLGNAQKFVDLVKNLVLLVVVAYSFYYGASAIKKVSGDIATGQSHVTEAEITDKGVKFKLANNLKDIKGDLTSALDTMAKSEGKKDTPISPQTKDIATALTKTNAVLAQISTNTPQSTGSSAAPSSESAPMWVYLGIEKNHKWNPNYFGLDKTPEVGMSVTANTDIFERTAKPFYEDSIKDWKLGTVIGVLRRGESTSVKQLEQIEADNGGTIWWARIQ